MKHLSASREFPAASSLWQLLISIGSVCATVIYDDDVIKSSGTSIRLVTTPTSRYWLHYLRQCGRSSRRLPASLPPSVHFNLRQVGGSTAPLYCSGVAPVTREEDIASSSGEQLVDLWQHHVQAAGERLCTSPSPPVFLLTTFSPIPPPPHHVFTSSLPPPHLLLPTTSSSSAPLHHFLTTSLPLPPPYTSLLPLLSTLSPPPRLLFTYR